MAERAATAHHPDRTGHHLGRVHDRLVFIVIRKTGSTRMGAIALFTLFLVSYVILTYVGTGFGD